MHGALTGRTGQARPAPRPNGCPGRSRPRAGRPSMLLAVLALLCAPPAAAQDAAPPPAEPVGDSPTVTVLGGMGLSMGWFGGQVSVYTRGGRLSGLAGVGYTPDNGEGHPEGVAYAVGARAFTAGPRHRWFAGLTYGLVVTVSVIQPGPDDGERVYGPALLVGYQYTAGSGFTVLAGAGVGYAGRSELADQDFIPTLDLGIGYTWR